MIPTQQRIRRLALGLAALGRPAYINLGRADVLPERRTAEQMRERTRLVLEAAYDEGIRWVDTARSYGSAEEFLSQWLVERGYEDITVSSKWGYAYVAEWRIETEVHEIKEHSVERLHSQWEETHRLLDDRVSLYQVHSLTLDSPLFEDLALQCALARLRDSGMRLGFSTSGAAQADVVERAWELEIGGRQLFSAVQSTWNSLEPSADHVLTEVHHGGWQVLVKEPLANGRLAVRPPEVLSAVAERHGAGTDAIALAHVLSRPWADVVLLGPASVSQLKSNLTACSVELDEKDLADLATLTQEPATYWGERADLPWH